MKPANPTKRRTAVEAPYRDREPYRPVWTAVERRHIEKGYRFAMDAAGVPAEQQEKTLERMLRASYRREAKGQRAVLPADGQTRFSVWPGFEKDQYVPQQIVLRADLPHLLGHVAAHEGMHWLRGENEAEPTQTAMAYQIRYPLSRSGTAKRLIRSVERKMRQAQSHAAGLENPEHKGVLPQARVVAAVAESLRCRAGDAVSKAFLTKVRAGSHPYEAYVAVGKNTRPGKKGL